jgi:hypothetical protein
MYFYVLTQRQKEIAEGRSLYKLHLKAQFLLHIKHTAAALQGPSLNVVSRKICLYFEQHTKRLHALSGQTAEF